MLTRRTFLRSALTAGAVATAAPMRVADRALAATLQSAAPAGVAFDPAPFRLGVASGDPLPHSVILWTRLAQDPLRGGGMPRRPIEVRWAVALDRRMRRVVASGTKVAQPAFGHSVHVDVRGLEPGTVYWYRFEAQGVASRLGRTKTAPAPGSRDLVRFAFVSCQNFGAGQYAAYRGIATELPDFVVHLGDYIYEGGGPASRDDRGHVGDEPSKLTTYRNRHALYKGDALLKSAHAAAPFIVTWDDHEVDNNYRSLHPQDDNAAEGNASEATFRARRQAAYQAYYEHMPIRVPAGLPAGGDFRIYRTLRFGDVLDLSMIDTRQYGSDQPDPELPAAGADVDSPDRTILGDRQRRWLLSQLDNPSRRATWHAIGNQVQVHPIKVAGVPEPVAGMMRDLPGMFSTTIGLNGDSWDGYQHDRRLLLDTIAEREIPGVVVLTGDIHTHWVSDLKQDFNNPLEPAIATEFVGTSITSSGFPDNSNAAVRAALLPTNPHIRYYEGERHGYAMVEATPDRWRTSFRVVEDLADPASRIETLAVFEVEPDAPGAQQVAGALGTASSR